MRFDDQVIFPNPVLRQGASDYRDGYIHDVPTISHSHDDGSVTICVKLALKQASIQRLVAEGMAKPRLVLSCRSTYYSETADFVGDVASVRLDPSDVHGKIQVTSVICAVRQIDGFSSPDFIDVFSGHKFDISEGDFLAFCPPREFFLDRESFGDADSVVEVRTNEGLDASAWLVDGSGDKLVLHVSQSLMAAYQAARRRKHGVQVAIASLFLPAIMYGLEQMKAGDAGDAQQWVRVFKQRLALASSKFSPQDDTLGMANDILGSPTLKALEAVTGTDQDAG